MDQAEDRFIRQLEKKKRELQEATGDPKQPCRDYLNYRENLARIDEVSTIIELARKTFSGDESDADPEDKTT